MIQPKTATEIAATMIVFMLLPCLLYTSVKLKGIKLHQAAAWTTAFLDSENIWVEDLEICNDKRYNGDGLDFDGCRNVFVAPVSYTHLLYRVCTLRAEDIWLLKRPDSLFSIAKSGPGINHQEG